MDWISVEDRLPEPSVMVRCKAAELPGYILMLMHDGENWEYDFPATVTEWAYNEVTHGRLD